MIIYLFVVANLIGKWAQSRKSSTSSGRGGRGGGGVSEDIGYFFDKKKGIFRFVTP